MLRGVTCLEDGVFDKTQAGFFRLTHAEIGLRHQLEGCARERLYLAQFAQVAAGEYDAFHIEADTRGKKKEKSKGTTLLPIFKQAERF